MDCHKSLAKASQEALQAWAAQHMDVEKARLAQPNLNTFLGITLQGTETLEQRHYQEFRPLSDCQSSSKRIGKESAPHPPSMGQNVPEMSGMMQRLLTRLPLRSS